jgi:hypothetical protein
MKDETDILLSIYNDIKINIEHIKTHKLRISQIQQDIDLLNNNFFNLDSTKEVFSSYLSMFDDDNIYKSLLTNLETLENETKNLIINKCNHEWIDDYIDIFPDRGENVCYCIKCDITKKQI